MSSKSTNVVFVKDAQQEILRGSKRLFEAVKTTMGPSGHSVIIERPNNQAPFITKDGVTVAKAINLKPKLEAIGANLVKEVASKTNEVAGDGPQPLYSKILTPDGWTTLGKIKPGDVICGTNNTLQEVIAVYPKGNKNIVKVVTSDNRVTECCEDHLWEVTTSYGKKKVITTKEMIQTGVVTFDKKGNKKFKYFLPLTTVDFGADEQLPIDPYLLGVLLGDGSLTSKKRSNVEISLGLNDEDILEKLNLPKNCAVSKSYVLSKNYIKAKIIREDKNYDSSIKEHLSNLKLLGTKSDTKFIPKKYLYSSIEDRKKLLDGLIDTDGHINKRGLFEYGTVSEQLHLDFIELTRGLGIPTYSYKVDRKDGDGSFGDKPIYRTVQLKGYKYGIKIKEIVKTDAQTEMQCIKVSNLDNLYITNDYIVTHNTTTATVLGYSMLEQGFKMIGMGFSPIDLKQGMDDAVTDVIEILEQKATKINSIEDAENVATISANGDRDLGKIIAEAIDKVGVNGIITVEPAKNFQTTLQMANGIMIDGGYTSPFFITNSEKANCVLENPYVLVTNQKIASVTDILPILENISVRNKPLLIICDDVEGEALQTLITNKMRGTIEVCAVKAPSFGDFRFELLSDISHVLGTEVIGVNSEFSLKNFPVAKLGKCVRATITRTSTILVAKDDEETKAKMGNRAKEIEDALAKPSEIPDEATYNRLRHRLAKLTGGVAVIRVGGSTEVEIGEKKDRVDDALNATLAATREGIVAGGGMALYYCSKILEMRLDEMKVGLKSDSYLAGYKTIIKACEAPFRTIVSNTGRSEDVFSETVNNHFKNAIDNTQWSKIKGEFKPWSMPGQEYVGNIFKFGIDARKGEWKDLIQAGIIDPVLVTKSAISFANSIVGLTLTCNAIIIEDNEENVE